MRALLVAAFGEPLVLRRRGSARARSIGGAVAAAGALLVAGGIAWDVAPLAIPGVLALVFGLATLGALSQKVAGNRPEPH